MIGQCGVHDKCTASKWYWLATAGFLSLVIYGSLVPLHYRHLSLDEAMTQFQVSAFQRIGIASRSDFATNVLLFIPLSFLLLGALSVDRSRRTGVLGALVVVPFCTALSLAIEFLQVYFPPRVVSANDVIAETIGGAIGATLWVIFGQRITEWIRSVLRNRLGSGSIAAKLLPAYLLLLAIIHVMPLDLTVNPGELHRKYKEGRVAFVPFASFRADGFETAGKLAWQVAYFLPLGVLLGRVPSFRWGVGKTLLAALTAAAVIEGLQLFVFSRHFDTTDIITVSVAILPGWWLARPRHSMQSLNGNATQCDRASAWRPALISVSFLAWTAVLVVFFWSPFNFTADPSVIDQRLHGVNLVPFADLYPDTEYHAFNQVLRKTLLFMPLGVLAAFFGWTYSSVAATATACGLGLLTSLTIEAGQVLLPGHYPSLTDVLIGTTAVVLGFVLTLLLRKTTLAERGMMRETL